MLLFRSEEHIEAWYTRRGVPMGATLTLDQQWELARIWYGERLSPAWRRRTPEEVEATFAALGLSGTFWKVTDPTG